MIEKPFISVIVPFYNAKTYLKPCIDSILSQTYSNFELLLINDGSNDYSIEIAKQYTHIDKVKLFHMKNQGVAKARTYGFHQSTGSYILFIDADDWIRKNTLQKLVASIHEADIVICSYRTCYHFLQIPNHPWIRKRCYSRQHALKKLCENQVLKNYFWGRLYKRELLNKVNFTHHGLFEDISVMHHILMNAEKVIIIPYQGYCYRIHSHSLTSSMDSHKTILMKQAFFNQQLQISTAMPTLKLSNNPFCMADIMLLLMAMKQKQKIHRSVRLKPYPIKRISLPLFLLHLILIMFYRLCHLFKRKKQT